MEEGDSDWNYAYYALFQLDIKPWEFAAYSIKQKAAIVAMINRRIASEKKERAKARKK